MNKVLLERHMKDYLIHIKENSEFNDIEERNERKTYYQSPNAIPFSSMKSIISLKLLSFILSELLCDIKTA